MKSLVVYILVFTTACLSAQSIKDELTFNRIDISRDSTVFQNADPLLPTLNIPIKTFPIDDKIFEKRQHNSRFGQLATLNHLNIYSKGEFRASFNSTSGMYLQESDRKAKKDIRKMKDGALQKVLQLEPVSYLMKNQKNQDRALGLVAQDVREVFPALVEYVEGEEVLAVSYIELIPVLIKALQEQQNTIQNLKDNQYLMQKEFAVFQLQIAQLAESLADKENAFETAVATVAQNQN